MRPLTASTSNANRMRRPEHLLGLLLLLFPAISAFLHGPPAPAASHRHRPRSLRCQASATAPRSPRVVIVGAGVGGLSVAGRLARAWPEASITVVEQNAREAVGGRLNEYRWGDYRWETGPSLLLLPEVYAETFAAVGTPWEGAVELAKVEPSYLVVFDDDDTLDLYTERAKMADAIERLEPGSYPKYCRYLDGAQANLDFGFPAFIEEKHDFTSLPGFMGNLVTAWPLQGHYRQLAGVFQSEKLRAALSFQDLYVGLSPYAAPAVFSLLQAIELNQGVYYPKGGFFGQIAQRLLRAAESHENVQIRFGTAVQEIAVDGQQRAAGVVLADGSRIEADVVLSNVDAPFCAKYLLPRDYAQAKDHDQRRFSSSVVSFLWAFDTRLPALRHHSVFLAAGAQGGDPAVPRAAWEGLFEANSFDPNCFNFYVHAPARTDPGVCPPGHDAIMVLVPCPILGPEEGVDEEEREQRLVEQAREGVLRRMERLPGMGDMRDRLIHERVIAPREWRRRYSLSRGAVFGLSHDLLQLSLLRPGPRNAQGIRNLYHVGASNRPGNGVPLVMVGAKLVTEAILKDHGQSG